MFVAAEPFDDMMTLSIEDPVGPGKVLKHWQLIPQWFIVWKRTNYSTDPKSANTRSAYYVTRNREYGP